MTSRSNKIDRAQGSGRLKWELCLGAQDRERFTAEGEARSPAGTLGNRKTTFSNIRQGCRKRLRSGPEHVR